MAEAGQTDTVGARPWRRLKENNRRNVLLFLGSKNREVVLY